MKFFRRITATLVLAAFSAVAVAGSGYEYLDVDQVTQQHSNWCWAATSVDVLRWYGNTPTQCDIVNWAFDRNDACGNNDFNWSSSANSANGMFGQYGSIEDILNSRSINTQSYSDYLSWNTVVNDINANRPFIIRFGWYGGGGHFLVGYGYHDLDGTRLIGYMNPWPGEGYTWSNFDWTVYADYDHSWTHSLRTSG